LAAFHSTFPNKIILVVFSGRGLQFFPFIPNSALFVKNFSRRIFVFDHFPYRAKDYLFHGCREADDGNMQDRDFRENARRKQPKRKMNREVVIIHLKINQFSI
jgi:hypothetical protein